jgi:hypothetical protein
LFVIHILATFFQFFSLSVLSSLVISPNTIIVILFAATESFSIYVVLHIGILLWILGVIFMLKVYPVLKKLYPLRILKYTKLISLLIVILPNFATTLFEPSLKQILRIFDCRFDKTTGNYLSVYEKIKF